MTEWARIEKLDPGRKLVNDVFTCVEPSYGFGVFYVDMENAHAMVQRLNQDGGPKVTYLHLFVRACGLALKRYPQVNAMMDGPRRIRHPSTADIGVSVAGKTNYAPVVIIEAAENKNIRTIAEELAEKAERARNEEEAFCRKLEQMGRFLPFGWLRRLLIRLSFRFAGFRRKVVGTFQISCLPEEIIVPFRLNTTALMGLGHTRQRPAVVDGKVVPRRSVYFSIPIDHRVVDGKEPMLFAYEVIRLVESPELLLEDAASHAAEGALASAQ